MTQTWLMMGYCRTQRTREQMYISLLHCTLLFLEWVVLFWNSICLHTLFYFLQWSQSLPLPMPLVPTPIPMLHSHLLIAFILMLFCSVLHNTLPVNAHQPAVSSSSGDNIENRLEKSYVFFLMSSSWLWIIPILFMHHLFRRYWLDEQSVST